MILDCEETLQLKMTVFGHFERQNFVFVLSRMNAQWTVSDCESVRFLSLLENCGHAHGSIGILFWRVNM